MKSETFVDTSGFYALLSQSDDMHSRCVSLMARAAKSGARFVTSDYVLDETATLLRARGQSRLLDTFFDVVLNSQALRIEWMDPDLFEQIRKFFFKHSDKDWSFTDCFSFCLMRELRIQNALTKDDHFRQAGFNPLLI
ncbi:MAG TPA: PIN domain-containing protein [Candidatus Obscuribacterales bacterium]